MGLIAVAASQPCPRWKSHLLSRPLYMRVVVASRRGPQPPSRSSRLPLISPPVWYDGSMRSTRRGERSLPW